MGISVGPEQVKRAYRKALLLYHPDKTGRGDEDEVFLGIQKAENTLSDVTKRRAYDSQNEFDDEIPSGEVLPKGVDFYALYGPVFHSNGRFAVHVPVVALGDAESDDAHLFAFYKYWENFESWRDFTLSNQEHDPDAADSREEKRWMIKENMKGVKQLKNKDNQRIITLVERAKQRDPRIRRAAEREKEAKRAAKEAKHAAKHAVEAEAAAAVQAAADAKASAEAAKRLDAKAVKEHKEKAKKALRRLRAILRRLVALAQEWTDANAPKVPKVNEWDVDTVCEVDDWDADLGVEKLAQVQQLIDAFGALEGLEKGPKEVTCADGPAGLAAGLKACAQALDDSKGDDVLAAEAAARAKEERAEAARQLEEEQRQRKERDNAWTKDELAWLAKGSKRFASASGSRWESVATYVNQQMRDVPNFKLKTKEQCLAKITLLQAEAAKKASNEGAPPAALAAAKAAKGATAAANGGATGGSVSKGAVPAEGSGGAPAIPEIVNEGADELWSKAQQEQLEVALKKFPSTMDKAERWGSVSKEVEGKGKKQCVERFKFLRAKLAAAKK